MLLVASTSSCAHYQTSDWQANITLPATLDCYGFNVMSGKETRLPAEAKACEIKKLKSVWIDYENYKILRGDVQKNCQLNQCTQMIGAFDNLFLKMDAALGQIPK